MVDYFIPWVYMCVYVFIIIIIFFFFLFCFFFFFFLTPSLLCILHAVCRGTNDHMRVCSLLWLFLRKLLSDFNKTARDGQKHNTVYIEPRICCNCSELFGLEFFLLIKIQKNEVRNVHTNTCLAGPCYVVNLNPEEKFKFLNHKPYLSVATTIVI